MGGYKNFVQGDAMPLIPPPLRRLKTWLLNTMTECRLNSVCVCHTHQVFLDSIDLQAVLADFCTKSDVRLKLFGRFFRAGVDCYCVTAIILLRFEL